ncbi:ABC transporter permease [Spirosoma endophyticum]|uniref:ABC-type antimicrobial peptide transport system, permease component n=1 Tax=Spirosoma endophyticum TaxID=662367 RepID=A0A1I1H4H0_9BACT|nr:ABC transporter permease [Spirosoma endophyticum]SFC18917.1 ABC-type antimicrobial peptide transport system, permease component [Spirosoma endophyticum]
MTPPRLADKLLTLFCAPHLREEVLGDLHERYVLRVQQLGEASARRRYWRDVVAYMRPTFIKREASDYPTPTHTDMLRNYLKIAFRNLTKNKVYSAINIAGLATGMAVAMLIGLWVWNEFAYNQTYANYDRIAKVMQNQTFNDKIDTWSGQAMQLAPELRRSYGGHFKYVVTADYPGNHLLSLGNQKITKSGNFMEPDITEMLALTMLKGTRAGLNDPFSILLSESAAKALFGNADPLNKLINLDKKWAVKVSGVYADLPQNSSFQNLAFIAPWELKKKDLPEWLSWGNSWFQTFVQIADNAGMDNVSATIKDAKLNKVRNNDDTRFKPELFLLPMRNWHLYSEFKNGVNVGGQIQYVWLFSIIGFFVLLLACINFMNLSTARSEKRAREVGVRKAIGSLRKQIILQFFSESFLVVSIAFALALLLVLLALPGFNSVADRQIGIPWSSPLFWFSALGFSLLTSLVAGSYPAIYLSSFQPIKVLKGTFQVGRFATLPRKVLVVVQFTVSITLIIGTLIVFQQIDFAKNRPVGYSRSSLLSIPIKTDDLITHFATFRDELLNTGAVEEVAATDSPITDTYVTNSGLSWKGKAPNMTDEFVTLRVTHEFGKMIGWQVKEGRDFSKEFPTDSTGFVLNEAAVAYMGLKNPINEIIQWGDGKYKVIGVVKNLITQSPYEPVKQTIFFINYKRVSLITVKINPAKSASEALAKIETIYKKYDPDNPFDYKFADQEYARKFGEEERIGKLASFFAVLAIFISCLGLFGLASFVMEQRTKEIGIRKVMGASVANLWQLLSRDFVVLVVISLLIAGPMAWYFMQLWIQKYTYRTELSWWIFAASGAGALLITLLTVSFQSIKAALMNPVKSLRSE